MSIRIKRAALAWVSDALSAVECPTSPGMVWEIRKTALMIPPRTPNNNSSFVSILLSKIVSVDAGALCDVLQPQRARTPTVKTHRCNE